MIAAIRSYRIIIPVVVILLISTFAITANWGGVFDVFASAGIVSGSSAGQTRDPWGVDKESSSFVMPASPFAGITVNTLVDENNAGADCSLREAITAANTNAAYGGCTAGSGTDTITVSVAGTLTLTSALPAITSDMTIDGGSQAGFIVSGNNLYHPFTVTGGATIYVTITRMTITNGLVSSWPGGGCIGASNATLIVSGVTIDSCTATSSNNGGAISTSNASLTVEDSQITNNRTTSGSTNGGGIYVQGPAFVMTNSLVSGNHVAEGASGGNGGGMYLGTYQPSRLENVTVSSNTTGAGGNGAGINLNSGTYRLSNVTLSGNSGAGQGGGLANTASATIRNSTIADNTVTAAQYNGGGGGIQNGGTQIQLSQTTFLTAATLILSTVRRSKIRPR